MLMLVFVCILLSFAATKVGFFEKYVSLVILKLIFMQEKANTNGGRKCLLLIPNGITGANMLLGVLATYYAFSGYSPTAARLILIAAVLDFFDGFFARLLRVQSSFGKEFDSLADIVSFGVAPAAILFDILQFDYTGWELMYNHENVLPLLVFVMVVFSGVRLARFNMDSTQEKVFKGMPTPANALIVASLPLMMMELCHCSPLFHAIANTRNVLLYVVVVSVLMNMNVPMLSLKFSGAGWKDNAWRYLYLGLAITGALVILLGLGYAYGYALAYVMLLYVVYSLLFALLKK